MILPRQALGDGRTRVLLAVMAGVEGYAALMRATGLTSKSTIHHHLHALRAEGLITFETGTMGTVRPCVSYTT